jgi:hypothetical protein
MWHAVINRKTKVHYIREKLIKVTDYIKVSLCSKSAYLKWDSGRPNIKLVSYFLAQCLVINFLVQFVPRMAH